MKQLSFNRNNDERSSPSAQRRGRKNRIRSLRISAVLLVLASGFILFTESRPSVPPMDDVYIHLVFGRSLFSSSPLSFNEDEISSGFTSPAWLIPAGLSSLAGKTSAPVVLMILSLLTAGCAIYLAGARAGMLILLAGPFFFHSASGMETSLSCLLVVALWLCIKRDTHSRYTSFILAAAFLCRPELLVLALPVIYAVLPAKPRKIFILLLPVALAAVAWGSWNLVSAGRLLPSTFYAKQSFSWAAALIVEGPGLLKNLFIISPLFLIATLAGSAGMIRRGADGSSRKGLSLGSFPALLFLTALVLQPNSYFQLRYYVPAICASALAAGHWLGTLRRHRLNTLLIAASMIPGLLIFGSRRSQATLDVGSIDVDPAEYLLQGAYPAERVAAADIGAVKWITGMQVIDLDGLVTEERLPGESMEGWAWIRDNSDYLLAFPDQYSGILQEAEESLEFIEGFSSRGNIICGEDSVALWRVR